MRRCGAEGKGRKRGGRVWVGGRVAVAGPLLLLRSGDWRLSRVQIAAATKDQGACVCTRHRSGVRQYVCRVSVITNSNSRAFVK
jgi:hypothetical protein